MLYFDFFLNSFNLTVRMSDIFNFISKCNALNNVYILFFYTLLKYALVNFYVIWSLMESCPISNHITSSYVISTWHFLLSLIKVIYLLLELFCIFLIVLWRSWCISNFWLLTLFYQILRMNTMFCALRKKHSLSIQI